MFPWYALAPDTYRTKKTIGGSKGCTKGIPRFLIIKVSIIATKVTQMRFSNAAIKLDELVTSTPIIGRNRNVEIMYGALQAIQKYVLNFVGGVDANKGVSLGQL